MYLPCCFGNRKCNDVILLAVLFTYGNVPRILLLVHDSKFGSYVYARVVVMSLELTHGPLTFPMCVYCAVFLFRPGEVLFFVLQASKTKLNAQSRSI